jgi:hypothetical protein
MNVREAIDRIDSLKHNTYTNGEKIDWLNRLDGMIKREIIDTHEGWQDIIYKPYTEMDMETDLLISAPHDGIYIRWLETQIDYYNGEIGRYNNSMRMYQEDYDSYSRYYNRTHMPLGHGVKYFGGTPSQTSSAKSIVNIRIEEG